ncbi:YkvA family protein [Micromonospora sp. WMMA1363]|uniref:YkvA family protein n=1 Tax=Micromonospora sp. WMMA1363 TaxID=3053985 RepID=UPI00259D2E12|nr:YkvA family protein [Micromonospora sp. WMMA1363]MDM4722276.1 YkvA family protein [Micromonospora sp. WMMA1363]
MSWEVWLILGVVAAVTLVGAVLLAIRVLRMRRLLGDLGVGGRVACYGALIYAVVPVDALPDPIYLDDMAVLAGALLYLGRLVRQRRAVDHSGPALADRPASPATTRRTDGQ